VNLYQFFISQIASHFPTLPAVRKDRGISNQHQIQNIVKSIFEEYFDMKIFFLVLMGHTEICM